MDRKQQKQYCKEKISGSHLAASESHVEQGLVVAWIFYWPGSTFKERLPEKSRHRKPRKSLNSLLLFLGASYCDVYRKPTYKRRVGHTTIYDRYSINDLAEMLERLYREFKNRNHPDRYKDPDDRKYHEILFKDGSEAYRRARKILSYRERQTF